MKRLLLLLPAATLLLPACRATYPTGRVEEAIARICEQEYGMDVQVGAHGKTIGAQVVMPDVLLTDLTLSDRAFSKLENVMLTTSRVTLSSEFPYDFFVVSILDAGTGVRVSFLRYIKDIRRLVHEDISRSDYLQRMVIDVSVDSPPGPAPYPPYRPADYQLGDFLARQIAERVQTQFKVNLVVEPLFHLAGLRGAYVLDERDTRLVVTAEFLEDAPPFAEIGSPELREAFLNVILDTARTVTRRYEFREFGGLDIMDRRGPRLARFGNDEFAKDSMNSLMDLIRQLKDKTK